MAHPGLAPSLEGVQTGVGLQWRGKPAYLPVRFREIAPAAPENTHHGNLRGIRAVGAPTPLGIVVEAEFALPESGGFLLWRLTARNQGRHTVHLDVLELARLGPAFLPVQTAHGPFGGLLDRPDAELRRPLPGALRLADTPGDLAFFANGYQSWSFAGALTGRDRMPGSIFGPLGDPKHLNLVTPRPRQPGRLSGEMFGLIAHRAHNSALVVGFLSQKRQFGVIEVALDDLAPSLRLRAQCDGVPLPPGGQTTSDWAYLEFVDASGPDPLAGYLSAAARENDARLPPDAPAGWCSWYQYFAGVTEQDYLANLEAVAAGRERLPLSLVLLDDGFEPHPGDWLETNEKFPHGLGWLAEQVRARGLTPGLWLAPFIATRDARIVREHPDWFIRAPSGGLANAGYNWWKWCYGLDPTHPAVQDHTRRLIETAVRDWGFQYLKLDFLYAAALPGRRCDPTLTRAQALRLGLELIREAAGPETFLLGCGCPLGSAIGLVDAMRIGTDVDPHWDPFLLHPILSPLVRNEAAYVSARNAIRNTLTRAPLHRRWWLNDPDCLLVRDSRAGSQLTDDEVIALATAIALSGGLFTVSDDLTALPPERRAILEPLLPVIGRSALARDWLDRRMPEQFVLPLSGPVGEWTLVGLFNWSDRSADRVLDLPALGLSSERYHVFDFWNRRYQRAANEPLTLPVAAHGARLLAVRPDTARARDRQASAGPQFVASTLHFSQGSEVKRWAPGERRLSAEIELGRVAEGEVWLALPAAPARAEVAGVQVTPQAIDERLWRVPVTVRGRATVALAW